jgi:hypothetical protein
LRDLFFGLLKCTVIAGTTRLTMPPNAIKVTFKGNAKGNAKATAQAKVPANANAKAKTCLVLRMI